MRPEPPAPARLNARLDVRLSTGHLARLLAFDTSTETMTICAAGPVGEAGWSGPGGAAASAGLLPQATRLLADAGLEWADVQAIAFGAGPGAFTGLRTACSVAQGLAFGLGCPVLPLDSLAWMAEDSGWRDGPVWVAMDARMDEVYAGRYRWCDDHWGVESGPALYTLPALAAAWQAQPPGRVAGSAVTAFAHRLPLGGAAVQPAPMDRATALMRLARQAWAQGAAVDPALALPTYVRDKVALTTAERVAVKQAAAPARP